MKKFIYILNILLLVLVPTTVFIGGKDNTVKYEADTANSVKLIKTTVLLDRSNKKQEEKIKEEREKEAHEEEKKQNEEEAKKAAAIVKKVAVTVPVKVVEEVGSLASSEGASDATVDKDVTSNTSSNVGTSTTVTVGSSEKTYVGYTFSGNMSAYGRDCCSSNPLLQGLTASGFNIKEKGMYYQDATYGRVRILASSKADFYLYSVIKINDPIDGEYKAIVLDRGDSNIGIGRKFVFDLVVESQEWAKYNYGVHRNVNFEVLRIGK